MQRDLAPALGWAAALLLHGALLAVLILDRPAAVPAPAVASVTLLVQHQAPAKPQPQPAAPRPDIPARTPPKPAAVIGGNPPRAPQPKPAPAARAARAAHQPKRGRRQRDMPLQGPVPAPAAPSAAPASFIAAAPLPGNVNPAPIYPPAAIAHGEEGSVLLSIHVLPDGRTDSVSITQSSGYRALDQAAQDAVLHWRFTPAMLNGRKVAQVIPYRIKFDLQTETVQAH